MPRNRLIRNKAAQGSSLIEHVLLGVLIAMVCFVAMQNLAGEVNRVFFFGANNVNVAYQAAINSLNGG